MEENGTGTRIPTGAEIEAVAAYERKIREKTERLERIFVWLIVLFDASLAVSFPSLTEGRSAPSIVAYWAVVAVVAALPFMIVSDGKKDAETVKALSEGKFRIRDGKVTDVETDATTVGKAIVYFVSDGGGRKEGPFSVLENGLEEGSRAKLVSYEKADGRKRTVEKVFTEYMLSPEGIGRARS